MGDQALGKVYLIGAGPGDPKLITVKGLEALKKADIIVYDRLASPKLLQHAKPGAELRFVGKLPDKHAVKQEDINRMLVDFGLSGLVVARLKGGDPSVFGRVGEEAELLAEQGVPFEIVPGITSAIAVPAYAGIPVTHRDFTSSFSIVTGHEYPNKTYGNVQWDNLAGASGTLIFLMGVANLANISQELIQGGKSPETPVALIRWGTWMEQETITGTLSTIAEVAKAADFRSPAVIIVGDVVKLRERIAWFEKRPLFGRRILVTRAQEQASELAQSIEELGAEAVELPVIRIREPEDPEALRGLSEAVSRLKEFRWIVFTSVNGVNYFFRYLQQRKIDIRMLASAKFAAVGPKTEEALREKGLWADLIPPSGEFRAEALAEELKGLVHPFDAVLLPRGNLADGVLPQALRGAGLSVTEAVVYENVPDTSRGAEAVRLIEGQEVDTVTFTSSSTILNLMALLIQHGVQDPAALINRLNIACIGPVTAQTARDAGLHVTVVAERATIPLLVKSLTSSDMTKRIRRKGEQ